MPMPDTDELLSFNNRAEWRAWLAANYCHVNEARIVIYKSGPRQGAFSLHDAQEEALCFGWVDVKNQRLDSSRYTLLFSPRRAGSTWSISNIRRVEQLTQAGLMMEAGLAKVAEAQANGQWEIALQVEQTDVIPPDLEQALRHKQGALVGYQGLTNSRKRQILRGLLTAKSATTRQRCIAAIVQEALKQP
jgi:uncharacterized protein YdeI (YjbR/CyaY-like superfamily)